MIKMSAKQKEALSCFFKECQKRKIAGKILQRKVWTKIFKECGQTIPWKTFDSFYADDKNTLNTDLLFKETQGLLYTAEGVSEEDVTVYEEKEESQDDPRDSSDEENELLDSDGSLAVDTRERKDEVNVPRAAEDSEIPKEMVEPESDSFMKRIVTRKRKSNPIVRGSVFVNNPVYVVEGIDCSNDSDVIGVTKDFEVAFNLKEIALHDAGNMSYEDAFACIEKHAFLVIQSSQASSLKCRIRKIEMF
jgi:hypothetical protein